jgi:hypothetical protein
MKMAGELVVRSSPENEDAHLGGGVSPSFELCLTPRGLRALGFEIEELGIRDREFGVLVSRI